MFIKCTLCRFWRRKSNSELQHLRHYDYPLNNWINKLFSEENKVSRTQYEARKVAGSAKNGMKLCCCSVMKIKFVHWGCSGIKKQSMKIFLFWLKFLVHPFKDNTISYGFYFVYIWRTLPPFWLQIVIWEPSFPLRKLRNFLLVHYKYYLPELELIFPKWHSSPLNEAVQLCKEHWFDLPTSGGF